MTTFDPGVQPNSRNPASKCSCWRKASSGGAGASSAETWLLRQRRGVRGGQSLAGRLAGHLALFDHVVRSTKHRRRDRQAERSGGLEVDNKLELRGLLDREVSGFGTPEELVHIDGAALDELSVLRAVAHRATR